MLKFPGRIAVLMMLCGTLVRCATATMRNIGLFRFLLSALLTGLYLFLSPSTTLSGQKAQKNLPPAESAPVSDEAKQETVERPFEGKMPVGGAILGEKGPGSKVILETIDAAWKNPRKEMDGENRSRIASISTALWKEALTVVEAAGKTDLCTTGCKEAAGVMKRRSAWQSADLEETALDLSAGWLVRFRNDDVRWDVLCKKGDPEGWPDCIGGLSWRGRLILTYRPDSFDGIHQTIRLLSETIAIGSEFESDESKITLFRSGIRDSGAEIPFSTVMELGKTIASSELDSAHAASLAVDNRFATSWCEGKPDAGKGEWIELSWPKPRQVPSLTILPGHAKSRSLFFANNRVKRARFTFSDGFKFETDFKDVPALQHIIPSQFPEGTYEPWEGKVTSLRIEILDVYKGEKYDDTCISEIVL